MHLALLLVALARDASVWRAWLAGKPTMASLCILKHLAFVPVAWAGDAGLWAGWAAGTLTMASPCILKHVI